jgi:FkbM family methyltransferase
MNILVHGSIIGPGGIAHHIREFTKSLSKHHNVKIRNFNVDSKLWRGYTGPDVFKKVKELEFCHHKMLYKQSVWENDVLVDYPLTGYDDTFTPDIHIIMGEAYHYYYYQEYDKPTVVYFPWETTEMLQGFIEKLQKINYIWVPSEWQLETFVKNGLDRDKISVVNEGVDPNKFFPIKNKKNKKLRILHIGTWEYRKSSYEVIKSVMEVIGDDQNVDFRLAIHNKFREQESPEDTFKKYGLPLNKNITFLKTLSEKEYENEIKNADIYVSCSRGEGWNLPLIQSISSGVPSIYSKCGGQLEFTKNSVGIGIDILGEEPAQRKLKINDNDYYWELLHDYYPGNLSEPNYIQFKSEFEKFYNSFKSKNISQYNKKALADSKFIQDKFNWNSVVNNAIQILESYNFNKKTNMSNIFYLVNSVNFGDTLCATPTLRYLSQSHGKKINVVTHNNQVFNGNPYVDNLLSFDEFNKLNVSDIIKYESFTFAGKSDKNGIEKKYSHIDTRQLHAMDLGFQLSPSQMSYDFYPSELQLDIDLPEEYVVLHVTTNWPNRTWSDENWYNLIEWLKENKIFTVLIGSGYREELHHSYSDKPLDKYCPTFDNLYGIDLTNQGSMSDMWWVINDAKLIVTMDSGPLHLAGCTNTKIIQLGSAINPELRAPYRYGRQDYNYTFVGGTCNLFCNSNLFYNVQEWGHINSVPPMPHCLENKPTFECHPSIDKVITIIEEKIKEPIHDKFDSIIELIPSNGEDKIKYNYKVNSNLSVKIEAVDINTGLKRSSVTEIASRIYNDNLSDAYFWWSPSPGKINGLGNIKLNLYVNNRLYGSKKLIIDGDNHLEINGEKLILKDINDNSYSTFWEIFINKDYEKEDMCVVEPNDVVLDIGANYGFFTLYSLNKGASKVYSVEPFTTAYNHIKTLSDVYSNITPINKAISEHDGNVKMYINQETSAINCVTNYGEYFGRTSDEITVESISINNLLSEINETIDFLKVDCEGSEFELFKTISVENLKKIKKMVIESHGEEITNFVGDMLKSNNFTVSLNECSYENKIISAVNNNLR